MVVDDDPGVVRMLQLMLGDAGLNVIPVTSAREGLRKLATDSVDLIVTDIIMPDMEGIEFIMRAKEARPNIKIIAISGGGRSRNTDFLRFAERLGADGVLAKPFQRDGLLEVINRVLARD
jgi:CheY-like chemotaxis protein